MIEKQILSKFCYIEISAHSRSICICRLNRYGPRYFLKRPCQINNDSVCMNNEKCVSNDKYYENEKNIHVYVRKVLLEINVEARKMKFVYRLEKILFYLNQYLFISSKLTSTTYQQDQVHLQHFLSNKNP